MLKITIRRMWINVSRIYCTRRFCPLDVNWNGLIVELDGAGLSCACNEHVVTVFLFVKAMYLLQHCLQGQALTLCWKTPPLSSVLFLHKWLYTHYHYRINPVSHKLTFSPFSCLWNNWVYCICMLRHKCLEPFGTRIRGQRLCLLPFYFFSLVNMVNSGSGGSAIIL